MRRSGFTTIELIIVIAIMAIITLIGFPKILRTLDKTNVRSARDALGTLAATARAVWVTTACPTKVDTVSGVQNLTTRFKVTLSASRDSVQYDPRGLSMDGFSSNTVVRLTGSNSTNQDSVMINTIGKVVRQ